MACAPCSSNFFSSDNESTASYLKTNDGHSISDGRNLVSTSLKLTR